MSTVLEARELSKRFVASRTLLGKPKRYVDAVSNISLSLESAETLGVLGESGSGKSTLGSLLLRLREPDRGSVIVQGRDLSSLSAADLRRERANVRMVFQDPFSSLHPRRSIIQSLLEPLVVHRRISRSEHRSVAEELCHRVGLSPEHLDRYPYELSGGQLQRVAIARAVSTEPAIVVCDEPVAALDMSVRARVVNLLMELQRELGVAYVFISHDVSLVRLIAHRVVVMYAGGVVEEGFADDVLTQPAHPYTRDLVSAVPEMNPARRNSRFHVTLSGAQELHGPRRDGCPYVDRCALAVELCRRVAPELVEVGGGDRRAACHFAALDPPTRREPQAPGRATGGNLG